LKGERDLQPGDEKIVEVRLVTRKEDQRLLVGSGNRGDFSELSDASTRERRKKQSALVPFAQRSKTKDPVFHQW